MAFYNSICNILRLKKFYETCKRKRVKLRVYRKKARMIPEWILTVLRHLYR